MTEYEIGLPKFKHFKKPHEKLLYIIYRVRRIFRKKTKGIFPLMCCLPENNTIFLLEDRILSLFPPSRIAGLISHEQIHIVLFHLEGKDTCHSFDNLVDYKKHGPTGVGYWGFS